MRILFTVVLFLVTTCGFVFADGLVNDDSYYKTDAYKKYVTRSARKANPHQKLTGYTGALYCEKCHDGAIEEVMNTTHYKWSGKAPKGVVLKDGKEVPEGTEVGKKYKIGALPNTYPLANFLAVLPDKNGKPAELGCGHCHMGGGHLPVAYEKATEVQKNDIDCLLCHAGTYDMSTRKIRNDGDKEKPVLRLEADKSDTALQSVGRPTVEACMRCHYNVGGGALFKRGVDYSSDVDVHAAKGLLCVDCHTPRPRKGHSMIRSNTIDIQNYDAYDKEQSCVKCHTGKVHKEPRYDAGGEGKVACVTCHIKVTGGLVYRDFGQFKQSDKSGFYLFKSKVVDENSIPVEYKWWNGVNDGTFSPKGDAGDGKSKLYIFKKYVNIFPVDKDGNRLPTKNGLLLKKGPGEDLNKNGVPDNYEQAVLIAEKQGTFEGGKMQNPELKKSSVTGFKSAENYYMVSHGVMKKENALKCSSCHGKNPVISWEALGMKNPKIIED